ncbi:MAG: flagellar filament capping protein FliD [Firmicutes bacterium]|jgi:flagellar hook-associated protein 2|nr:flagellar filament capping protein FliD [Bacillota bacterium]MCL5015608.1 flagellar filament capping protein FliD [Bacillota bacterium]
MSGVAVNWAAVYGNNNVAAQMLSDLSLNEMESLAIEPLTQQLNALQQQLQTLQKNSSAWTTLQGDAGSFLTGLQGLGSTSLQAMQASTSNSNVATAAADGNAPAGTYSVKVLQMAQTEIDGTASTAISITNPNAALNLSTATVAFVVGGTSVSVAVNSTTTLNQLVSDINQSGAPVDAQAAQSGSNYYLKLYGTQTDQTINYINGTVALSDVGIFSSTSSGYQLNQVQAATVALVSYQGTTVSNATNLYSNLIPNVTLSLASTGSTNVIISPNYSGDTQSISSVFQDFNTWVKDTQNLAYAVNLGSASTSTGAGSYQFNGNQVIHSPVPMMDLNQVASQLVAYKNPQGMSLGALGITYDYKTSTFTVNSSTLTSAMQSNLSGVQQFFQQLVNTISPMIKNFSQTTTPGVTADAITNDSNQENQINQQISNMQEEIKQAIANAKAQYSAFVDTMTTLAQSENAFNSFTRQGNTQNGG